VEQLSDEVKMYISFLNEQPDLKRAAELETASNEFEQFKIIGREAYILIRKDAPKPIFNNNWLEKKLQLPGTARNWNTVQKLAKL
jgi:uncharacterized protein (DUF1697 family)